jgi:hypothetical protein
VNAVGEVRRDLRSDELTCERHERHGDRHRNREHDDFRTGRPAHDQELRIRLEERKHGLGDRIRPHGGELGEADPE